MIAAAADRFTWKVRGWTCTSKPILLWAGIIGVVTLVLSLLPDLVIGAFNITTQDLNNNSGLVEGWSCLSLLLSLALPVVGGWRATIREGAKFEGGMTGAWSVVIATVLGLIVTVIYGAVIRQLDQINGTYFQGLGEGLVLQLPLSFLLGLAGGWYSVRQRLRAQQAQELLTSSS